MPEARKPLTEHGPAFSTTLWTVVLTVRSGDAQEAGRALEHLCRIYWRPVYAFIRRRGASPHDAEDLTQGFFSSFLEYDGIKKAEKQKGKFRTFLLAALANFLNNEHARHQRLKRGGQCEIISLDDAEAVFARETAEGMTPEAQFDCGWAIVLVERVMAQLKAEYEESGKQKLFAALEPWLTQELTAEKSAHAASALGMSAGNVKVALHRLRRRFGEILRTEVAQTVVTRAEVDDEVRHLFASISD